MLSKTLKNVELKHKYQLWHQPSKISQIKFSINIFSAEVLRYVKYIQLYGLPEGGIFDPDKLAISINLLNQ